MVSSQKVVNLDHYIIEKLSTLYKNGHGLGYWTIFWSDFQMVELIWFAIFESFQFSNGPKLRFQGQHSHLIRIFTPRKISIF
jgi:hypothetical protein